MYLAELWFRGILLAPVWLVVLLIVRLIRGTPKTRAEWVAQNLMMVGATFCIGLVCIGYLWWQAFSFLATQ